MFGSPVILVSRLKSSLQSTSQKTSAVSDQTDTPPLCTIRDEISYPENCPCLPLLVDLQEEVRKAASRQIQLNLSSNFELTKLQEENNALKLRLRDVEDCYDSLKREARSIQDDIGCTQGGICCSQSFFVCGTAIVAKKSRKSGACCFISLIMLSHEKVSRLLTHMYKLKYKGVIDWQFLQHAIFQISMHELQGYKFIMMNYPTSTYYCCR